MLERELCKKEGKCKTIYRKLAYLSVKLGVGTGAGGG